MKIVRGRGHEHAEPEYAPDVAAETDAPQGEMTGSTEPERPVPKPRSLGAKMLLLPIVAYRRWISPALPARCRFYPSCSAYAVEAISTHGALRGLGLAIWRLLRCQPFNPGGYDPVPPPKRKN